MILDRYGTDLDLPLDLSYGPKVCHVVQFWFNLSNFVDPRATARPAGSNYWWLILVGASTDSDWNWLKFSLRRCTLPRGPFNCQSSLLPAKNLLGMGCDWFLANFRHSLESIVILLWDCDAVYSSICCEVVGEVCTKIYHWCSCLQECCFPPHFNYLHFKAKCAHFDLNLQKPCNFAQLKQFWCLNFDHYARS